MRYFGKLFGAFSVFAVIIPCMGLWGVATFTTSRRQKEVSIRKTLGASTRSIVTLFSFQFLQPPLIAGICVLPITWYVGQRWLEKFPYRMSFSIDLLLLPIGVLLVLAFTTVSYQTLKAATSNPVDSLKSE